jgi:hypothetical protein
VDNLLDLNFGNPVVPAAAPTSSGMDDLLGLSSSTSTSPTHVNIGTPTPTTVAAAFAPPVTTPTVSLLTAATANGLDLGGSFSKRYLTSFL